MGNTCNSQAQSGTRLHVGMQGRPLSGPRPHADKQYVQFLGPVWIHDVDDDGDDNYANDDDDNDNDDVIG